MIEKIKIKDHPILCSKINEIIDAINRIQRALNIEFLLDGSEPIVETYENDDDWGMD